MSNMERAIVIKDLSYYYKSHWTFRRFGGLQDLNLEILSGESFGFLGHNGAGKTTTIKCILGLLKPAAGCINIFGRDHKTIQAKTSVGYLPEQPFFYDHLTVSELLVMYSALAGVDKSSVPEALEQVSLQREAKSPMRSLSKGQTQRVAMAQAIVGRPRLLILDEPFSGLDPIGRKQFADLLFKLKKGGTTIFMSSHILSDVEFLCDRVSIMANGRLLQVFDLKEMREVSTGSFELKVREFSGIKEELVKLTERWADQGKFLTLTFDEREKAERALSLAIASSAVVDSFGHNHEGLEELFVRLVQDAGRDCPSGEGN